MKKSLIVLIMMFSCVCCAFAEETSLTLEEAITIALRDNPVVLLKLEDVKKAKAQISQAKASLFPSLTASGSWTDTRSLFSKDVGAYSSNIKAKQILYTGGRVINAIKIGEYYYAASEAIADATKLDTILAVKRAYYSLVLSERFSAVNKSILDNSEKHLSMVQTRFASGELSESDLIRMESDVSTVKKVYEESVNQSKAAQALLQNLLSFDKDIIVRPEKDFIYAEKDIAYDEAFLAAMKTRPEIKQIDAQAEISKRNVEVVKADNRPTVYASWDYYSSSRLGTGLGVTLPSKNWNDYNVLGVTVSWPIFDGWLTKAKLDQALIEVKEAGLLKDNVVKSIALDVKTSYLDLKNAIEKIKSVQAKTRVYEDGLNVVKEKYAAGIASELDLCDSQVSLEVALFNKAQADYDYLVSRAKFERATGGPL